MFTVFLKRRFWLGLFLSLCGSVELINQKHSAASAYNQLYNKHPPTAITMVATTRSKNYRVSHATKSVKGQAKKRVIKTEQKKALAKKTSKIIGRCSTLTTSLRTPRQSSGLRPTSRLSR